MTMVKRDATAEQQIDAAKKMPSAPIDNAGNPINSELVKDALAAPSGGVRGKRA